ncbi:hypothetical protein CAPTEDRAFT_186851 [Capitella teleta]|uniref:Leucine-rich repeat-containing protein 27 n=1 Tax=Capitella teleta TaxID=283909 RepID=R7UDY9_CAPTE|nr:hypothetical protein CAPTEDRAFT_186851 [Capitella teleta]|eukprot:ELU01457.1 hypothetical protein CAPTEDRAFT_186851 [Capitella teleta]
MIGKELRVHRAHPVSKRTDDNRSYPCTRDPVPSPTGEANDSNHLQPAIDAASAAELRSSSVGCDVTKMSVTNENEPTEPNDSARSTARNSNQTNGGARSNANGVDHNGPDGDKEVVTSAQKKKQKLQEIVNRIIAEAKALGSVSIDLSFKEIRKIPDELLEMTQLEHLYLEGNKLSCLPDTFFHCLPNLKWLDLRRNCLVNLPSLYIGRHKNLRNLLLESNELRTLPLELGLVKTLNGLNIAHNPLEFPPVKIVEIPSVDDLKVHDDSDDSDQEHYGRRRTLKNKQRQWTTEGVDSRAQSGIRQTSAQKEYQDLVGPVPSSASLHKPPSYNQLKTVQAERIRKAGASGQTAKKKKAGLQRQVPLDHPVSVDKVEEKYLEERRLAYNRDMNDKEDAILQKRRDVEAVKDWRNESKSLQSMKMREKMMHGGKLDYEEPATQAPFGYDENDLKMVSSKERMAQEIRSKHEKLRRAESPSTLLMREEARKQRDLELQAKLMGHMEGMQERRKKPQGTPQEEMLAAQQELQMAEQLQRNLVQRRKEMEYRFTAFAPDIYSVRRK